MRLIPQRHLALLQRRLLSRIGQVLIKQEHQSIAHRQGIAVNRLAFVLPEDFARAFVVYGKNCFTGSL